LAKTEIGGTKGKILSASVTQIYGDFLVALNVVRAMGNDVLDLRSGVKFEEAFYDFRARVKELDRRLASIIIQGFDDCGDIINQFRLLDSFDVLLLRPLIADEMEKKYVELLTGYQLNLTAVQKLFMESRSAPNIASNLPPIAGALYWSRGLLERIRLPTEKLKLLDRKVLDRDEAVEAIKTFTYLTGRLQEFEKQQIKAWADSIEATSQAKLKNPLLRREEVWERTAEQPSMLYVNFDPLLVRLLREVKYFLLLELNVPDSALEIYAKAEGFRRDMGNLDLIVNMYNSIQTNLHPVERPLFRDDLDRIDRFLAQATLGDDKTAKLLNWKSNGIDQFIKDGMALVKETFETMSMMKNNYKRVKDMMEKWKAAAIFERHNKCMSVEDFDQLQRGVRLQRYHVIKEGGQEIHKLLKETNKKLKASAGHPDWKAYVDYVNDMVVVGLIQVVVASLEALEKQLDPVFISKSNMMPMLEVELDLRSAHVIYHPAITNSDPFDSKKVPVKELIMSTVDGVLGVGCAFKRLDTGEGHYLRELQDDPEVEILVAAIRHRLNELDVKTEEYRRSFFKYTYLWQTDANQMFQNFLEEAVTVDVDETAEDTPSPTPLDGEKQKYVDLDMFDEQIRVYVELQGEVASLKHINDIDFLHINAQPVKQAISGWVTKWIYLFTQYLQDFVSHSLKDIDGFIARINKGLEVKVSQGDMDSIMAVTRVIRDVRKRMADMESVFEPLKDMVILLKNHGVPLELALVNGRTALDYLEVAPVMWESTVNKAFKVKEEIQPLQNSLTDSIRKDVADHRVRVSRFIDHFHRDGPFNAGFEPRQAYTSLSMLHAELYHLEETSHNITELEELFELAQSQFIGLKEARQELELLKMMWDMVDLVDNLFSLWKTTLWADINTDALLEETKSLQNHIKRMSRRVREWDIYRAIESRVQNMATILPLISQLHSPAMRDRHWRMLIHVTQRPFEKGTSFALQDVLGLDLHLHVEAVSELVHVANEELKVETRLKMIEEFWKNAIFQFVRHKDTEVFIIAAPDSMLEALEEHQVQLQSMGGLGNVDFFRDSVIAWQETLGEQWWWWWWW